jgi:deoxyribose-phosphate aldolase
VDVKALAKTIDHTLLKPDSTQAQMQRLCEEAARHGFATVCLPPCYVRLAAGVLAGTGVGVATVVSFPHGNDLPEVKRAAVGEALAAGATELDVVMNISKFLSGEYGYVADELLGVVAEAGDAPVKVIIETAYLDDAGKRRAVELVAASGAAFVKTSTGFAAGGATVEDVRLLREVAPEGLSVKASGGIRTLADARAMLEAEASRLGASAGVGIVEEAEKINPAEEVKGVGGLQG